MIAHPVEHISAACRTLVSSHVEEAGIAFERMNQSKNLSDDRVVLGSLLEQQELVIDLIEIVAGLDEKLLEKRFTGPPPSKSGGAQTTRLYAAAW
nr:hypothetical protein [Methylosinus trichosporium]